jgi:serine/threonine-protein kinase
VIGSVIGSYQLVRKLGEGGMGAVYLGQHTLLGRRAAIKVLLPMLSARPDIVSRFFNEARAVTSISDPGIVQVFDFGYSTDGSAFIVMEFLEGEPLDQRLAKLRRFSVPEALRLCRQIATSLGAAHAQHIIHRDLKPENIFLVRDAEVASGERSKILDFGIAKLSDEEPGKQKTHVGALMGTPVYMSPEQCRGLPEIDHRADIYSLGCVLFHLITGRPPFEGVGMGDIISAHIREPAPLPSSLVAGIAPSVDALMMRCLAKNPNERFSSMGELAAVLGQIQQQLPVDAVPGYVHGGESSGGAHAPAYYSQPPRTPPPPMPPTMPPAYPTPTTLGASIGQRSWAPPPPAAKPRLGRWIGGLVVLSAVGVGIGIVGSRSHHSNDGTHIAASDIPGLSSAPSPSVTAPGAPPPPTSGTPPPTTGTPPPTTGTPAGTQAPGTPPIATPDKPTPPIATPDKPTPPIATPDKPTPPVATPDKPAPPIATPEKPSGPPVPAPMPANPHPSPATPVHAPPSPAHAKCGRAEFAAVYDAAAPTSAAVHAALKNLRVCHEAKSISDADFDRYQAALVAKL